MNASMIRNRYVGDSVATASPARLVTMLYDRLVRDLATGEAALAVSDLAAANSALVHAQDIVWELAAGLDPTRWSGGPALAALYQFTTPRFPRRCLQSRCAAYARMGEIVPSGVGRMRPYGGCDITARRGRGTCVTSFSLSTKKTPHCGGLFFGGERGIRTPVRLP